MYKNILFFIFSIMNFSMSTVEAAPTNEIHKVLKSSVLEKDYQKLSQALDKTLSEVMTVIAFIEQNVDRQKLEEALANLNQKLNVDTIFSGINLGTPGLDDVRHNVTIFMSNVKVPLIQSVKDIIGIQRAKQQYGEKPEFKVWIKALDHLESKTKAELHQGKNFLEAVFTYAKANFIALSPQATAEEKQAYQNIASTKEQEVTHFLQALQQAAAERYQAFTVANEERQKLMAKK